MIRPTHLDLATGAAVFPEGYDPAGLHPLPDGYWEARDADEAVAAIKAQAERDCLAVAPLWQQLNDVRKPTPEGAARFAAIDAIRAASNKAEADIKKVKNNG